MHMLTGKTDVTVFLKSERALNTLYNIAETKSTKNKQATKSISASDWVGYHLILTM